PSRTGRARRGGPARHAAGAGAPAAAARGAPVRGRPACPRGVARSPGEHTAGPGGLDADPAAVWNAARSMAVLLAALSAATFGIGDFFGGLSARRMAALLTTVAAQAAGLGLVLASCLAISGSPTGRDLLFGALAGVAGAVGLVLFYWAMGQGPMSVVAPVSAVMSALVPVVAGVAAGERPGVLSTAGILLGLPAIVLISREPTPVEAAV